METVQRICSKSGNATARLRLANPEPSPCRGRCRDWTGSTWGLRPMVKGQSGPQTPNRRRRKPKWYESWGRGFESRRGHHLCQDNVFMDTSRTHHGRLGPTPLTPCILLRKHGLGASDIERVTYSVLIPLFIIHYSLNAKTLQTFCRHFLCALTTTVL